MFFFLFILYLNQLPDPKTHPRFLGVGLIIYTLTTSIIWQTKPQKCQITSVVVVIWGWINMRNLDLQKPPLGGRPNTKTKRPWHSQCSQPLIYFILICVRTCMNKKSLEEHVIEDPVTYGFTLHLRVHDHTTWFWRCVGTAFGHFLLGSHNVMVTALGSCVKWSAFPYTLNSIISTFIMCHTL